MSDSEPPLPPPGTAPARRGPLARFLRLIFVQQTARRTIMFWLLCAALACVLGGEILFSDWLRQRPYWFLGVWAGCAGSTLLAVLLALVDLLMVRATARAAERALRSRYQIDEERAG